MEAAAHVSYQPSVMARSLSFARSNIVGIVMTSMTKPCYPELLEQLTWALQHVGPQTLLFKAPCEDVESQLPLLLQYRVDAVVIASAPEFSMLLECMAMGGGRLSCSTAPSPGRASPLCPVTISRAVVPWRDGQTPPLMPTAGDGVTGRLVELGIALHARAGGADYRYDHGYAARLEITSSRPGAIFYIDDITAFLGMDALRQELKMRVPGGVAVVGFDDIPMTSWPSYQLTTVKQLMQEISEATLAYLGENMFFVSGKAEVYVIAGPLIERAFTGGWCP